MITLIMASRQETEALEHYLSPLFFVNHSLSIKPANTSDFRGKLHYLFQVPDGSSARGEKLQVYLGDLLDAYERGILFEEHCPSCIESEVRRAGLRPIHVL